MRVLTAVIVGFFSGLMIYLVGTQLLPLPEPGRAVSELLVTVYRLFLFLGGWILTSVLFLQGTSDIQKMISRGFLLGAVEWVALFAFSLFRLFLIGVIEPEPANGPEGGCLGCQTGLAIPMAILCLFGFLIAHLWGKKPGD